MALNPELRASETEYVHNVHRLFSGHSSRYKVSNISSSSLQPRRHYLTVRMTLINNDAQSVTRIWGDVCGFLPTAEASIHVPFQRQSDKTPSTWRRCDETRTLWTYCFTLLIAWTASSFGSSRWMMINCLEFLLDRFIFVMCQKGIFTKLLDNGLQLPHLIMVIIESVMHKLLVHVFDTRTSQN